MLARRGGRIGYTRNTLGVSRALLVPFPTRERVHHINSLNLARGDGDRPLSVRISMTPIPLREEDHQLLASFVQGSEIKGDVRYATGRTSEVQDPQLLELLRTDLE